MSNLYMEPGELRRIAERILGARAFDYRPALDEIRTEIGATPDDFDAVMTATPEGYVDGRSGIGSYHDQCLNDVVRLFENIDLGLIAMSNVLATVAEDYTKSDGEAGTDLASTLEYFEPGGPVPR